MDLSLISSGSHQLYYMYAYDASNLREVEVIGQNAGLMVLFGCSEPCPVESNERKMCSDARRSQPVQDSTDRGCRGPCELYGSKDVTFRGSKE